ncbi:hypothetical protein B0T24DRAFT_612827 [Lasiosphaeria ovina]|uniref:Uncharacterized protein n=1 Tax=Lasiosphaeria ovina TaxID=92902 RepID=A0AAE0NDX7_9PEZI|nr:hypothetical protein B0T24DRAFT_612827 [Lasiosphaeria ovina]
MNSSSRAPAPPPLKIGTARAATSPMFTSPTSADSSASRSFSDDEHMGMLSSPSGSRKASGSSMGSSSSRKAKCPPNVNAHSYCGRHSDQYLFGGHSLGDLWRSVTKKE